jgi:hypothetical protein
VSRRTAAVGPLTRVDVDRAAESLNRGHGAGATIADAAPARASTFEGEKRAGVDGEHGAAEPMVPCQEIAQTVRQAQHPLADGDRRQRGHAPSAAARAEAAPFAGKRHQTFGVAIAASNAFPPPTRSLALRCRRVERLPCVRLCDASAVRRAGVGIGGARIESEKMPDPRFDVRKDLHDEPSRPSDPRAQPIPTPARTRRGASRRRAGDQLTRRRGAY